MNLAKKCFLIAQLTIISFTLNNANASGFASWLDDAQREAASKGVSETTLEAVFPHIYLNERVIKLDRKQPEGRLNYAQYLAKILPKSRMKRARRNFAKNKDSLSIISRKYGVPERFIIALWGIESDFGSNTGGFDVLSALASLAYEGRRAEFFRAEFINALKIIDEGHVQHQNMKGSWAGAMGQSQFMPSTFLSYAVDENGDSRRNIWGDKQDVFASIANYLKQIGWEENKGWGLRVRLPVGIELELVNDKKMRPASFWSEKGLLTYSGKRLPSTNHEYSLIIPDKDILFTPDQEVWQPWSQAPESFHAFLVTSNFNLLLEWNKSKYFASTVGLLSDEVY